MSKPKLYVVENFDDAEFCSEGYFSSTLCVLKGIRFAREEKQAKSEGMQREMKIYELVEVKKAIP